MSQITNILKILKILKILMVLNISNISNILFKILVARPQSIMGEEPFHNVDSGVLITV